MADKKSNKTEKDFSKEAVKLGREEARAAKLSADISKQKAANTRQTNKATQELIDLEKEVFDVSKNLTQEQLKRLELQREIVKETLAGLKQDKAALDAAGKNFKEVQKAAKVAKEINKIEAKALPYRKKLLEAQKKLNKLEEQYGKTIKNSTKFLDTIEDSIREIPIVGDFLADAFDFDKIKEDIQAKVGDTIKNVFGKGAVEQKKAAEEAVKGYDDQIDKLNGVETAAEDSVNVISETGPAVESTAAGLEGASGAAMGMAAALGPVLIVALAIAAAVKLFEKALELDQEITDMSRGLGISREEAEHIHHELLGVAENTEVIGANSKELSTAFTQLAKDMGSVNLATAEMAETQVLLTKQYGLAGEEASNFQKMAMVSGKTAEQNVVAIQNITEEMTGGMMNYKDVMKDVAGTSKAVQATFKGNIGQLTKAVITAKKFGKTLDDVKKITDGLLDIEGSIEKEMEARVLTGKDINLDQARLLKLKGDEAGAMEEIMKQVGSYDELMKMAPYQQEALAAAAGMTVDELVSGAEQQKLFNDLSAETGRSIKNASDLREEDLAHLSDATKEQAKALVLEQQRASATERMSKMGDKLMALFTELATPIMDMLEPLLEIVDDIMPALMVSFKVAFAPLKLALNTILLAVDAVKLLWDAFKWLGSIINTALGDPIGWIYDKIKAVSDIFGKIGGEISSWWGGIKSFVENRGETKTEEVHDAQIAPDGGLMVSGQKGTYKLASDDTVVAGTGLGESINPLSMLSNLFGGGQQTSNESETVALLKQIAAAMNQPVVVKIGNKVVNEIDKVQTMNRSYVGKVDNSYGAV